MYGSITPALYDETAPILKDKIPKVIAKHIKIRLPIDKLMRVVIESETRMQECYG